MLFVSLIMDNNRDFVWNVSSCCISGEKIQIQVYRISDTDKYISQNVSRYNIQDTYFVP